MAGKLDDISFQLGQMSNQLTNLESQVAAIRMDAGQNNKKVEEHDQQLKTLRKQIGLAILIVSSALYLIGSGFVYFKDEIKNGLRVIFGGHS